MSGQIFISYRREESQWLVRSMYDRLATHFDRKQIASSSINNQILEAINNMP
jgi:hypothetical protein